MAKPNQPTNKHLLYNWGKILIDTSVIIRAINYVKNKKEQNRFCYDLFRHLADTDYNNSNNNPVSRTFYVSAISVAEILEYSTSGDVKKSQKIIQALTARNLTILDFDEDAADVFDSKFCSLLNKHNNTGVLQRYGEGKNAREALTNDLMILASGISIGATAFICLDKGMYKIGRECGLNIAYADEKYFNISGTNIFEFLPSGADKDFDVEIKEKVPGVDLGDFFGNPNA